MQLDEESLHRIDSSKMGAGLSQMSVSQSVVTEIPQRFTLIICSLLSHVQASTTNHHKNIKQIHHAHITHEINQSTDTITQN